MAATPVATDAPTRNTVRQRALEGLREQYNRVVGDGVCRFDLADTAFGRPRERAELVAEQLLSNNASGIAAQLIGTNGSLRREERS